MAAIQYRPSIDGMRALAVIPVLLFHLGENVLPGGFIGVDIFFVLSGYLITAIIYAECQSGTFSLSQFYQRRISRIFPVFLVVTLSTLAAASVLYTSQDFASSGALSAASALSLANLKLTMQGNYFEVSPDSQPFLHFWSLSVEEQFYLLLPTAIFASFRFRAAPTRRLTWICAITFLSLVACIFLTFRRPAWAFYLLPTRCWELLAGSLLAASTPTHGEYQRALLNKWGSTAGLLLIVLSVVCISERSPFPGYVATLPVLGTLLLIGTVGDSRQFTERILSASLMVGIGRLSYSLYLWHWPVYCFTDYTLLTWTGLERSALKAGLTFTLSILSFFFIERPVRILLNKPHNKHVAFVFYACSVLGLVVLGVWIRASWYLDARPSHVASGGIEIELFANAPRIVLMGDSNASMYGTSMKELAARVGANANVISVAASDPFPPAEHFDASLEFLIAKHPAVTLFVSAWAQKIGDDHAKLTTALTRMLKSTSHIVLITQPPHLPAHATREFIRNGGSSAFFEEPSSAAARHKANVFLKSLQGERVRVVDIERHFVEANGQIRFVDERGRQLFQDTGHLSGDGANLVLESLVPVIREILSSSAAAKQSRVK